MIFSQNEVILPAVDRGFHLITTHVETACPELRTIQQGLLHAFLKHTSASLTINENADPDVREDMETALNMIVPESLPFVHSSEGSDDMPAHVKTSMMGSALTIPVRDGALALGTWQGIYLCEHRNHGGRRRLIVTLMGA